MLFVFTPRPHQSLIPLPLRLQRLYPPSASPRNSVPPDHKSFRFWDRPRPRASSRSLMERSDINHKAVPDIPLQHPGIRRSNILYINDFNVGNNIVLFTEI